MNDTQVSAEVSAILDESKWPNWPILPMKRLGAGFEDDDRLGIMIAGHHRIVWVSPMGVFDLHLGNLANQLLEPDSKFTKHEFKDTRALVSAGWIGD